MSLLHLLPSSGSLATIMANAMLEDDFKSSHPDLSIWDNADKQFGEQKTNEGVGLGVGVGVGSGDNDKENLIEKVSRTSSSSKRTSDPRSVVIQVPPKRRKLDPSLTARRLVHEIGTSATIQDRLLVLQRAKEFLDHGNVGEHDDEIHFDLDVALTKQLVMLVLKLSRCRSNMLVPIEEETQTAIIEEVSSTLEAFEMVYRASDNAVGESFRKIGPDLLHVLVSVMDEELNRRVVREPPQTTAATQQQPSPATQQHSHHQPKENTFKPIKERDEAKEDNDATTTTKPADGATSPHNATNNAKDQQQQGDEQRSQATSTPEPQRTMTPPSQHHHQAQAQAQLVPPTSPTICKGSPEGNHLLLKAIKVMGNLARVGKATKPMAFFPGLLRCMLNLINYQPHDSIPWEARLSALWILGQLACNPENMQMMMCTPTLVRSLVRVGCRALHPDDPMEVTMEVLRSRSLSSRALLNLSWKPENKIPLADNLALVELLTQLAVHRKAPALNNSKTVQTILQQTRCHAVGGLRNLAAAPRRTKIQLCDYRNGHVLDALTDVALNDPDPTIVNRAFAAIHNLAVHDNAQKMVERPALVLALKDVLLEEQQLQQDDNLNVGGAASPRSHASATLLVLERTITPDMASYQNLRDLLDAINPTVPTDDDDDNDNNDDDGDDNNDNTTITTTATTNIIINNNNNNNNNNKSEDYADNSLNTEHADVTTIIEV